MFPCHLKPFLMNQINWSNVQNVSKSTVRKKSVGKKKKNNILAENFRDFSFNPKTHAWMQYSNTQYSEKVLKSQIKYVLTNNIKRHYMGQSA